jgi:hypothetical protein
MHCGLLSELARSAVEASNAFLQQSAVVHARLTVWLLMAGSMSLAHQPFSPADCMHSVIRTGEGSAASITCTVMLQEGFSPGWKAYTD